MPSGQKARAPFVLVVIVLRINTRRTKFAKRRMGFDNLQYCLPSGNKLCGESLRLLDGIGVWR